MLPACASRIAAPNPSQKPPNNAHDSAADDLQYLHDLRVVRALEIQGVSAGHRDPRQLADRVRRVLFPSPRQPLGLGTVLACPTEGHAGDHHAGRLQRLRRAVPRHEARLEPRRRVPANSRRSLLREVGHTNRDTPETTETSGRKRPG